MGKIVSYTKASTGSEYATDVEELIAALEINPDSATVIAVTSDVQLENGKTTTNVANVKRGFQFAARDAGKSARVVNITVNDNGTTDITFILNPLIVRSSKSESTDVETATDAEYPVDSAVSSKKGK